MGHDIVALSSVDFVVTLQRGTEWAATGAVTQKVPASFPTAQTVSFRDGPDGEPVTSRFIFARVHAAHGWRDDERRSGWREGAEVPPREEWLIAEWPEGHHEPTDYWISNLPADTQPERLARLARMRWKMELDYKQLKGELGLDHYEGRSWLGWYHHTALVTAAHGFLTLERLHPFRPRPG